MQPNRLHVFLLFVVEVGVAVVVVEAKEVVSQARLNPKGHPRPPTKALMYLGFMLIAIALALWGASGKYDVARLWRVGHHGLEFGVASGKLSFGWRAPEYEHLWKKHLDRWFVEKRIRWQLDFPMLPVFLSTPALGRWTLQVPLWVVVIFGAVGPAYYEIRHRLYRGAGLVCRTCFYDLTGNASGVCPECGSPIPDEVKAALKQTEQAAKQ
jgi:hypothetical protein